MGLYVVDGNNLKEYMARVGLLRSADDGALVAWLQDWVKASGAKRRKQHRVLVWFDAGTKGRHSSHGNVLVKTAPPGMSADEAIIRELRRLPAAGGKRDATLVTSDRALADRAQALGVRAVDCTQFAGRAREATHVADEAAEKAQAEKGLGRLGSLFGVADVRKAVAKGPAPSARISPRKVAQMRDLPRLLELLRQGDRVIRRRAVLALAAVGSDKARSAAEETLLRDGVPSVRAAAAEALAIIGDARSVPALEQAAGDGYPLVREAVARALRRYSGGLGAAALERLAQDPHRRVRRAAIELPTES